MNFAERGNQVRKSSEYFDYGVKAATEGMDSAFVERLTDYLRKMNIKEDTYKSYDNWTPRGDSRRSSNVQSWGHQHRIPAGLDLPARSWL